MKKTITNTGIALVISAIFIFCFSIISQQKTIALSCPGNDGYVLKDGKCYNSATKLSFDSNANFYLNGIYCGSKCKLDGTGCSGLCSAKSCQKDYSQFGIYTKKNHFEKEIKYWACYNPQTHISYDINNDFYLNAEKCGEDCDKDGKNCKKGFCNYRECAQGYTQIKSGECYNPVTGVSYDICFPKDEGKHLVHETFVFNFDDKECGRNCDLDGSNCDNENICLVSYCNQQAGYTKIRYGVCYNEKTGFSYNSKHDMYKETDKYKNKSYCGTNCDINTGKHCQKGACDVSNCAKNYSQFRVINGSWQCLNPTTGISYVNEEFYRDGSRCGEKCDLNGRNCKKGVCDVLDCAAGYTILESGRCVNPETQLSYSGTEFFYKNRHCGYKCDYNGLNCKEGNCDYKKLSKTKSKLAKNTEPFVEMAEYGAVLGAVGIGAAIVAPIYYTNKGISKLKKNKPVERITKAQKNTPDGYTMILLEKNHPQ